MWGIVAAAGSGSRFGGGKQEAVLGGRPLWVWARDLLLEAGAREVVVVGTEEGVPGGRERRDSVAAGLAAVPEEAEVIAVHDAARPLASPRLAAALLVILEDEEADGAVPALPPVDTIKEVSGGRVVRTLDRQALAAVQTPQVFRAEILRRAHAEYEGPATDDAAMVEAVGGRVVVIPGERRAMKITYPEDLALAEGLLRTGNHD